MKSQVIGLKVASVLFLLVAIGHLARMVLGWKITIGSYAFPMWPSVVVIVVAVVLGVWLWMLAGCSKPEATIPPTTPPKA